MIAATSSGVPTGWSVHRRARPLRAKISRWTRSASARESRMMTDPEPGRAFDLRRIAAHRLAVLHQDRVLALHVLEAAAHVVGIAVLRDELERDLLAAATDEDRQAFLDRRRIVAHGLGRVARARCRGALAVEHPAHDRQAPRQASAAAPGSRRRTEGRRPRARSRTRRPRCQGSRGHRRCGRASSPSSRSASARGTCSRPPSARCARARWPAPRPRASSSPRGSARRHCRRSDTGDPTSRACRSRDGRRDAGLEQARPVRVLVPTEGAESHIVHRSTVAR